jgi:hypothetical protein
VWNIHVSDKVVAPQSRRTVSRGHGKTRAFSGAAMELSGIWAICPFQGRCGRHFGLAGSGTRIE